MKLAVHTDRIINTVNRIKSREADRASDAGEDREEIGNLVEFTGINKTSLSWFRSLDKKEPEKRDDILRSFDALREIFEGKWGTQKTPDMFADAVEPAGDDAVDEAADDDGEPGDEELQAEADDFDAHLAEVSG